MTEATTQPRFFAARPAIRIDGKIEPLLGDELLETLLVEESTQGMFRCEAAFRNWGPRTEGEGLLLFDKPLLDFGKVFAVEFGPPDNMSAVFAGRVSAVEAHYPSDRPPELVVLAEDRLQDLRMERRTRVFEDMSDKQVFEKIAAQHGLRPQLDLDGPTYKVLAQVNQSDLAFLRERAAAIDAELWVDDRTIYAQARGRRSSGSQKFIYGKNLLEFSVIADLADQRTSVEVCGWDVGSKSAIDEKADEAAISGELNGGRSGSTLLGRAMAERKERIVASVPLSKDEAKRMAEARFRERARRFVRGTGVVDGNVKIRVGATVELSGLGAVFDGKYYVSLCRHAFDLRYGFRTTFEVERPAILVTTS
jgi:phage protein D